MMTRAFVKLIGSLGLALLALLAAYSSPARADQGSLCMPTAGTVSGLQLSQNINAALQALVTGNSGGTAPTNPCSGAPKAGQWWIDTAGTLPVLKLYDGTAWQVTGTIDTANGRWTPPLGGGADSLSSASTTDLWTKAQSYLTVSGTTTITSFGGSTGVTGTMKMVSFSGVLQITYNATSLILPTAASITTQAGDKAMVVNLGGGNTAVIAYTRADGSSLAAGTISSNVAFTGIITPSTISGTVNNWAPTGLASASVVRAQATSSATVTGITAQPTGQLLLLQNIDTATTITLADASASSTAANRFSLGVDYVVAPQSAVFLRYDGTLSRWVMATGPRPASTAQAAAGTDTAVYTTPFNVSSYVQTGYRLVAVQRFTSSGTYTPTSGTRYFRATLVGGGGAGGGVSAVGAGQVHAGGGGGGGAVTLYMSSTIAGSYAVTIGTGATGTTGSGADGTATSLGAVATAPGGSGGDANSGGSGNTTSGDGGVGGGAGTGTIVSAGQPGDNGAAATNGWYLALGGNGGGGLWGVGGGRGNHEGTTGTRSGSGAAAGGYGAGGGGAANQDSGGSASGGNGSDGIIIIEEYI